MKGRRASGWLYGVTEMRVIVGERFVGVRIAAIKQGLSFESNFLCPAGTGLVLMLFWPPTRRAARAMKPGLSFERGFLCPAGTGAFFLCCLGRLRRGGETFAARLQEEAKQGLSSERRLVCPAGTRAFLFMLFGPPPAGARRGLLWGCAPFSAPLASPPKHPASGFQLPYGNEGCAASASGASLPSVG